MAIIFENLTKIYLLYINAYDKTFLSNFLPDYELKLILIFSKIQSGFQFFKI